MSGVAEIQIVTVYDRSGRRGRVGGRAGLRWLSLVSLVVAGFWVFQLTPRSDTLFGHKIKIHSFHNVDWWIKNRVLASSIGQVSEMSKAQDNPLAVLGLAPGAKQTAKESKQDRERKARLMDEYASHMKVLGATRMVWVCIAWLAGLWLLVAAVLGLLGRRVSRKLHVQAAVAMLLSTCATVAGIYVAIHWGGMPGLPDEMFYAKIAFVQSAFAWVILLATRFIR